MNSQARLLKTPCCQCHTEKLFCQSVNTKIFFIFILSKQPHYIQTWFESLNLVTTIIYFYYFLILCSFPLLLIYFRLFASNSCLHTLLLRPHWFIITLLGSAQHTTSPAMCPSARLQHSCIESSSLSREGTDTKMVESGSTLNYGNRKRSPRCRMPDPSG